ncbi:WD40 repeat-like protein [Amniculicola lignicola CBS 123094]|uniref:WD40 repeat-like protein n=1 Tax=Amniculicola lignicola CBS 123094 TaxID=1392246 RepID=A0A6A5W3W1_9PLEO|nr:WD40 repeat-like protein [Amniculicola lignicola CBS 123094]
METLETSPFCRTTSLSIPSPTGSHIAHLAGTRLQLHSLASLTLIRNIPLPAAFDLRNAKLAWSPPTTCPTPATATPPRKPHPAKSNRVLISDDDNTRVYDLRDPKWQAVISNGSGGMGKNVHVAFGRTEDEVVVFSDYASKATIWCLRSGRTVEIKDPKFSGKEGKGWGYRPGCRGGGAEVLAMLCRAAGQDLLMLLAPGTYKVVKRVEVGTVDAQGLKWSGDGRWIAVWDAQGVGYRLDVYTADGHLYRTIARETPMEYNEFGIEGLGIKSVEWVPGGEYLAVGGWDRRVRILSTRTFAPVVFLEHTEIVDIPSTPVYSEQVDGRGLRTYSLEQQPVTPPKAVVEKSDSSIAKMGLSCMAFNKDGTLCATRDDSTPTTVWIWDLRSLRPRTILIQHAPVKALLWHPTNPDTLLIQCTHDIATLYMYTTPSPSTSTSSSSSSSHGIPEILTLVEAITKPAGSAAIKWTATWLPTPEDKKPSFLFGHQQGYIVVWPEGKDQILRFENEDGEESDDSLYDILTGKTPVPRLQDSSPRADEEGEQGDVDMGDSGGFIGVPVENADMYDGNTGSFEDTFREKKRAIGTKAPRGKSVFDESGMSEMF